MKKGEKKVGVTEKDEKKENKYQPNTYLSPKGISRKQIDFDTQGDKNRRNSSG